MQQCGLCILQVRWPDEIEVNVNVEWDRDEIKRY